MFNFWGWIGLIVAVGFISWRARRWYIRKKAGKCLAFITHWTPDISEESLGAVLRHYCMLSDMMGKYERLLGSININWPTIHIFMEKCHKGFFQECLRVLREDFARREEVEYTVGVWRNTQGLNSYYSEEEYKKAYSQGLEKFLIETLSSLRQILGEYNKENGKISHNTWAIVCELVKKMSDLSSAI